MSAPLLGFDLLRVGHCLHPECVAMRGGKRNPIEFPALVGLIRHPSRGYILYDTGYSRHFMEATRPFPECLYRMVTPPALPPREELLVQLESRNIPPAEIGTILISHFHADHIAGLRDFPAARLIATRGEYEQMRRKGRVRRLAGAFLTHLIPADFEARATFAEDLPGRAPGLDGFATGYDLLEDGSLIGVPLPGHTRTHLGVVLRDSSARRLFLVGDAAWKIEALAERRLPSRIAALLFANNRDYRRTFGKLAALHGSDPELTLIPSHCSTTWQRMGGTFHVRHD